MGKGHLWLPFLWVLWWPTFGAIPISCKCCSSDLPSPIGDIIFCSKLHLKENHRRIYWISIRVSNMFESKKENTKKTHWFHLAIAMLAHLSELLGLHVLFAVQVVGAVAVALQDLREAGAKRAKRRAGPQGIGDHPKCWTAAFWNHHK